jgi:type IV pilus assembly protein PilA
VVIIIIGVLSAIALPSFLNQAAKAKQTEAKTYVGSVNRAQQAYRIEKSKFAGTITDLEIGIPTATQDYTYTIGAADVTTSTIAAEPTDPSLKAYGGGVVVKATGETAVLSCQTDSPSTTAPVLTLATTGDLTCPADSSPMR